MGGIFSNPKSKPKWFFRNDELFSRDRNKIKSEDGTHTLTIMKPCVDDTGRYEVECMGIKSSAYLTVDEPTPVFKWTTLLPKTVTGYTTKETYLEATVSSGKAIVEWYRGDEVIKDSVKYDITKDAMGL